MADIATAVSPLRRRMIHDMMLRNLSPATLRSYLHAVTKFSRHFGRSPDRLGLEDGRALKVYLVSQGIFWPSLNQTVCALLEPGRDTRADHLCAHASQAASDLEPG